MGIPRSSAGIVGTGVGGARLALSLKTWSAKVVLCTNGTRIPGHLRARLARNAVMIRTEPAIRAEHDEGLIRALHFRSGEPLACDAVFMTTRQQPQCRPRAARRLPDQQPRRDHDRAIQRHQRSGRLRGRRRVARRAVRRGRRRRGRQGRRRHQSGPATNGAAAVNLRVDPRRRSPVTPAAKRWSRRPFPRPPRTAARYRFLPSHRSTSGASR